MFYALVATAALLYAIYCYRKLFKGFEKIDDMFPGKPTLPFLGNALDFTGNAHDLYNKGCYLCQLYRRSFRLWIGPNLYICLMTPSDIEIILNSTVHIKKSSIYNFLLRWIRRGLLTSYGDKWRKNRKVLTPAFHFQILDGFLEAFNGNGATMCDVLRGKLGAKSFNIMDIVKMCALDNICEAAMGVTVNAQGNPNSDYVKSIKTMCNLAMLRTMRPWLAPEFIFYLTPYGWEETKALKIIHTFTNQVIETKMKLRKEIGTITEDISEIGIKKKKAFLDLLLDYYNDGTLTLEEVKEEVDTFMFEGHDTITSALSFSFYAIANNPEIQDRAHKELLAIFGDDDRAATLEDIQQMKYVEMIVKESLRLYPSVAVYGRYIEKDIRLDEYATIPAGSEVLLMVPGIHRNPAIWDRPNVFDPDRFLPENVVKRHPYSYIPFSAGPRNCIGMKFAMMEMKAAVSKVLRTFELKPCEPREELQLGTEVTLQSQNGVPISIALRKSQK